MEILQGDNSEGGKSRVSKEFANLMSKVEKYRGRHVVAVEDEIVVVKDEKGLKDALKRLEEKYPGRIPLITFIPEEEVMIL
uniref:DUF5678 domain-containing protein n=1 Tax=Candidatus Methanophagaceae archaeon ANME-1 ERB6 TaxID=2759912 RepID=A0A7G9YWH8_9EURY|nr:hypothetical protein CJELADDK_00041 [Methanosarcinales archaeon ANME-1 ERB6]